MSHIYNIYQVVPVGTNTIRSAIKTIQKNYFGLLCLMALLLFKKRCDEPDKQSKSDYLRLTIVGISSFSNKSRTLPYSATLPFFEVITTLPSSHAFNSSAVKPTLTPQSLQAEWIILEGPSRGGEEGF